MIDYNLILYIGLFLIALGFILFMVSEMEDRRKDRELFHQQQLTKSFERNKQWNFVKGQTATTTTHKTGNEGQKETKEIKPELLIVMVMAIITFALLIVRTIGGHFMEQEQLITLED